ncbi:MAG: response regulator [Calditrichia bacterium]|nr:response regulator [Calditrichia bacterium]MCK4813507.1 response regulator [Candidatus Neomarinimicrobiota bacterium]
MKHEFEIVIVEDNPNDAELMVRSLRENRLANSLIVLEDGEQALDFIFCRGQYTGRDPSGSPKVIFLDLKLPKVDGLEVLKQVKTDDRTRKIPVIIVTSSKEDPDIATAYDLGANSYVVKPVDFDNFVETIKQLGLYWLVVNENPK